MAVRAKGERRGSNSYLPKPVKKTLLCFCTFPLGTCPIEQGFCIDENSRDQNNGVSRLDDIDENTEEDREKCLESCSNYGDDATGCEIILSGSNSGCYVHTEGIAKGNGMENYLCWVFSKCYPQQPPQVTSTASTGKY